MAGSYVSLVMQSVRGLDPAVMLTLVAMADCANIKDSGLTYPAVLTLCDRVGIADRRHMQRILRELTADGWLIVERASRGGSGKTTRYRLNLPLMRSKLHANSGHQTADDGGPQTADNRGPQTADAPKEASGNRGPQTAPTAVYGGINRGPQTARSLEPELIIKEGGKGIGELMREALKGNFNRNPIEKDSGQQQPEKTGAAPDIIAMARAALHKPRPARPRPMSAEEQLAFVRSKLAAEGK